MKIGESEFTRTKYDGLDGKTIVAYATPDSSFTLRSSKSGLILEGRFELTDEIELQAFAKLISEAWTDRLKLRPKLVSSASGH